MISARIFICHEANPADQQEVQLFSEVQARLAGEGAEVIHYAGSVNDEGFLPFLNQELQTCQWFLLVQSPQAVRSSQVRIAVSTVLRLLAQQQLQEILRFVITASERADVPADWATIETLDATQDAARALEKLVTALEKKTLVGAAAAPPSAVAPTFVPLPSSPNYDRPSGSSAVLKKPGNAVAPAAYTPMQPSSVLLPTQTIRGNWTFPGQSRRTRRALLVGLGSAGLFLLGAGSVLATESIYSRTHPASVPASSTASSGSKPGSTQFVYQGHTDIVTGIATLPDAQLAASASADGTVQVWNVHTGQKILTYRGHIGAVGALAWAHPSWPPPNMFMASGGADSTVKIWSLPDGITHFTYRGHKAQVNSVAWSPSGLFLASAGADKTVHIWSALTGVHVLTYTGHADVVKSAVWSPDGNFIASASSDKTVHIWSPWNGQRIFPIYTGHSGSVNAVLWSLNQGGLVSASSDGTIQAWQASGETLFNSTLHTGPVNALSISIDGRYLVSGSTDKTARVWDNWNNGEQVLIYKGHTAPVYTVAWDPAGQHVLSSGADTTVRVWQAL